MNIKVESKTKPSNTSNLYSYFSAFFNSSEKYHPVQVPSGYTHTPSILIGIIGFLIDGPVTLTLYTPNLSLYKWE